MIGNLANIHKSMNPSKPATMNSASRSALRPVSNGRPPLAGGWSSSLDQLKTPPKGALHSQRAQTTSAKKVTSNFRRRLSKSHGDLSKLRPKSPPLYSLSAEPHELSLSHGNFRYDAQNEYSPSYNHQSRQAIPSEWVAGEVPTRSKELFESVRLPNCEDTNPSVNSFKDENPLSTAIVIQGLSPGILGPVDFCIPVVRSYPADTNRHDDQKQGYKSQRPVVQHIDVTTAWKGLRFEEGQELYRIHQAFTTTLERMLASELWNIYQGLTTAEIVRGISFCRNQLVEKMADSLYSSEDDLVRAQLGLIRLYLAASDCLIQYDGNNTRDTSITVRVHHDQKSHTPYPAVEAAWVPDSILFKNLSELPREGQEFSIFPQYQSNSAFGSTRFPTNVRYRIESQHTPLSWLAWDDQIAGFKGIVPIYSETQRCDGHLRKSVGIHRSNPFTAVEPLSLEVKASLIDDNGFDVRFERVVRVRLTLNVLPWYAMNNEVGHNPCYRTGPDTSARNFDARVVDNVSSSLGQCSQSQSCHFGVDSSKLLQHSHNPRGTDSHEEGHYGAVLPAIHVGAKVIGLPDLAKKHAHLAAKYADMAQRHTDAEKHVRTLSSVRGFGMTQFHEPVLQVSYTRRHNYGPFADRLAGHQRVASGSSARSYASEYAKQYLSPPHAPALDGRRAKHYNPVDCGSDVGLPALPLPATLLTPSQTFDDHAQAWDRIGTPQGSPHGQSQSVWLNPTSRLVGISGAPQMIHGVIPSTEVKMRKIQAEAMFDSPTTSGSQDEPANISQVPATPIKFGETTSTSGYGSYKRRARSSVSISSPQKRIKEKGKHDDSPTLDPHTSSFRSLGYSFQTADGVNKTSLLGLRKSMASDEEEVNVPMQTGQTKSHRRIDSGYLLHLHGLESQTQPRRLLDDTTLLPHSVSNLPVSLNNISIDISDVTALEAAVGTSSLTQADRQDLRTLSLHSQNTNDTISRTTSSNFEVTVEEDPRCCRINRREQAVLWSELYQSEDSDKENKARTIIDEPRLSDEEKEAIEEAVQRSLNDLADDFSGIFLHDSDDEYSSGEDMPIHDEL